MHRNAMGCNVTRRDATRPYTTRRDATRPYTTRLRLASQEKEEDQGAKAEAPKLCARLARRPEFAEVACKGGARYIFSKVCVHQMQSCLQTFCCALRKLESLGMVLTISLWERVPGEINLAQANSSPRRLSACGLSGVRVYGCTDGVRVCGCACTGVRVYGCTGVQVQVQVQVHMYVYAFVLIYQFVYYADCLNMVLKLWQSIFMMGWHSRNCAAACYH